MSSKPVLIYSEVLQFQDAVLAYLGERFEIVRFPNPMEVPGAELARCQALLAPLGYPIDTDFLDRCPNLRIIASSTLKTPHIPRDAAHDRGVRVVCLEDERELLHSVTATAELAWGLVIGLTRLIPWAAADAQAGNWRGRWWGVQAPGMLSRMRLGVVGLGRLGSRVADYGLGFDMQVGGYSPTSRKPGVTPFASLPELLGWADIVSLHANHTPQTERMCDAAFFAAMRPGSFFVNTARGELVDEAALLAALESGHLGGAGLDVLAGMHRPDFSECVADHPLVRYARDNTNLLLTPYYAGATRDAWQATQMRTAELLAAGMEEAMEERC